jgi:tetratricopeptide (TPR) repeat protein
MHQYGVRDVEKLLRLPRSTIRSLIAAGFVTPARGPRNAYLFSFQDLIVLRTAQALATAKVPHRRIVRSLKELRSRLPEEMPLSGLSIGAIADHVVVREGGNRWRAESGQYLLAFEGDPARGSLRVIEPPTASTPAETNDWHAQGVALERTNAHSAVDAYRRAIAADPTRLDARINLGRLLHEMERFGEAERVYREAIATGGNNPLLYYNLGVLLDDMDNKQDAIVAYEAALRGDPKLADCHYNLALLYEEVGAAKQAIRHMSQYRRLVGEKGD